MEYVIHIIKMVNSNIKSNCIDGKLNGLYQEYYENGNKKIECNYIDNILNGLYQEYYENGNKKIECNYELGTIISEVIALPKIHK